MSTQEKIGKSRRGGLMMSWLVSYLIVLMLPLLAYGVTWVVTDNVVEEEVCENNLILVRQMRQLLDERLDDAVCLRDYLRANTRLSSLFPIHLPLEAQDHYDIWGASRSVQTQISQNQFVSSGYVYIHATDQALCNGSIYDYDLLMKVIHSTDQLDSAAWKEVLGAYHYSDFVIIPERNGKNRIALISSIPISVLSKPSATLVLMLDTDNYLSNVTDIPLSEDSAFYLLDEEGRIVASSPNAETVLFPSHGKMSGESGFLTQENNGRVRLFTYATLKNTGWKYVCSATLTISQRLSHLKMLMIISIISSALFGLMLAYWLAKRNFTAIHNLMNRLSRKAVSSTAISGNEYQQIEQILDDMLRNTDQLDRIVQTQTEQLRQHALERLLEGSSEADRMLQSAGIAFQYEAFHVMIIFLNETTETTIEAAERSQLLHHAMELVCRQCAGYADSCAVMIRETGVILLNMPDEEILQNHREELERAFGEEQSRLRERFRFLGISISAPCTGLEHIPEVYKQAQDWVNYALMLPPSSSAIYRAEKGGLNAQNHVLTTMQETLLVETIASGNESAARSLTEKFCEPLYHAPVDMSVLRCFFFDALAGLMRLQSDEEAIALLNRATHEMENALNLQQMQACLERIVAQLARRQQPAAQSGENGMQEEILRLIDENYMNADFNITRLADMMGRNLSYISKSFKDRTGIGLYDYLNRVRIAHAKKLIDQSNAPISSLIGQAGFENLGSFIRVFKKYEGMTPGAYQKSDRNP